MAASAAVAALAVTAVPVVPVAAAALAAMAVYDIDFASDAVARPAGNEPDDHGQGSGNGSAPINAIGASCSLGN